MLRFKVDIHEPLWRAGQTLKDAAFLPLPLPDNRYASWREFRIFVDFFRRELTSDQMAESVACFLQAGEAGN